MRFFPSVSTGSLLLVLGFFLIFSSGLKAGTNPASFSDSTAVAPMSNKLIRVYTGMGIAYLGSMALLNNLWYKDYPRSSFHSFNDNREWLQVDKAGHFGSSWYLSMLGIHFLEKLNAPKNQQLWIGGAAGLFYLTTIELLDGYSSQWGFSGGDMLANLGGSVFALSQHMIWKEQKIKVKFSYRNSGLSKYRPNVLGSNLPQRLFKDYSSQTYWLSFSPFAFSGNSQIKKMSWICLSAGYAGKGLLGARSNEFVSEGVSYNFNHIERRREFLLSFDIDLTKIPIKKKWYKTFTTVFCLLKIPAPSLIWSKNALSVSAYR